jgi:hypothetical protein
LPRFIDSPYLRKASIRQPQVEAPATAFFAVKRRDDEGKTGFQEPETGF